MSNSTLHSNGWISLPIDIRFEEHAKRIRAERDSLYGNIFKEKETDLRWVGDLGEMVFKSWLSHQKIQNFQWIVDEASGKPDFIIAGKHKVGIKTVKRKDDPKPSYAAGMTARHTTEPVDHFFFMTYVHTERRMWMVGGISREAFIHGSTHYKAGDYVHPHYQIRAGHEINNIDMRALTAPQVWLNSLYQADATGAAA